MKVLDRAFVADAILSVKRETLGQNFITLEELNYITDELEKGFKESFKMDISFTSEIEDSITFKLSSEIISKRTKYLSTTLASEIEDADISSAIYDKELILGYLYTININKLPLFFSRHTCINCNTECTGSPNCTCSRWSHTIVIGADKSITC